MTYLQNITAIAGYGPLRMSAYHGANERPQWGDQSWSAMYKYLNASMDQKCGVPSGYRTPYAWFLPMKPGGLAMFKTLGGTGSLEEAAVAGGVGVVANVQGAGALGSDIGAIALLTTNIYGDGSVIAGIIGGGVLVGTIPGSGSVSAGIGARALLSGEISGVGVILNAAAVGGLSGGASFTGSSTFTAQIEAVAQLAATLSGTASVVAVLGGGFYLVAFLGGSGDVDASLKAIADATAQIDGAGSLTSAITATAPVQALLFGVGSVDEAAVAGGVYIGGSLAGTGELTDGDVEAKAQIACLISIGSRPSAEDIASAVWQSISTMFNAPGTMGRKLNDAGGGSSPSDIAQAVWDALKILAVTPGSFGEHVQTLATSVQVDAVPAASAVAVWNTHGSEETVLEVVREIRVNAAAAVVHAEAAVDAAEVAAVAAGVTAENVVINTEKIDAVAADVTVIRKIEEGNWEQVNNQLIYYDTDGTTVLEVWDLFNAAGLPTMVDVVKRVRHV